MTENINKMMSYASIFNKAINIKPYFKTIDVHICNPLTYTHSTIQMFMNIHGTVHVYI